MTPEADSGASPAGSHRSTGRSDASLPPADILSAEEEWQAQEDWEAELSLPSTSGGRSSYCGSFRRSAAGLRMRGVASWPFRTPRRPAGHGGLPGGVCSTDSDGVEHPLQAEDIRVLVPYNAQVRYLEDRLPTEIRICTVDKLQGQQAQIVFFSMATSSGEEIPRNVEFLFSRSRLNVAVSRARCLAVLVCSPRLLDIHATSIEQMRLVNALCRFAEVAEGRWPMTGCGVAASPQTWKRSLRLSSVRILDAFRVFV
jgi:hypothetical protein